MKHYILTCLNVGVYSHQRWSDDKKNEWMEHRLMLFHKYTIPSILNQTCKDFTWLVLADSKTPGGYKYLIERYVQPIYVDCPGIQNEVVNPYFLENIPYGTHDIITTELDSDDAIHVNMVKVIQGIYRTYGDTKQIVFPVGAIYNTSTNEGYVMHYEFHIPTLIENRATAKTSYFYHNSRMPEGESAYVKSKPFWIQVIHEHNVANNMICTPSRKVIWDRPVDMNNLEGFEITN